jgi:hypothetical protein
MNPIRSQMVARAVQKSQSGNFEINIRNVSAFLPGPLAFDPALKAKPPFELDDEDLAPYLPGPTPEAVRTLAQREVEIVLPDQPKPPAEPAAVRFRKLEARSLELEHERADLRVTYDVAIRDELNARHELERVARAFMAGFDKPVSPDELLKQHAASEAERRRKIASGELPAPRRQSTVGPSVLDRVAFATGGARGRRTGPNGERIYDFRRSGERPNAEQMRRAHQAVLANAKLPSER